MRGLKRQVFPQLDSWLYEPGSLTRRCQQEFKSFKVKPCFEGLGRDRRGYLLGPWCQVREVLLLTDDQPFIFAHSVFAGKPRGPLSAWLKGLGQRSLGTLLFHHPGFRRGKLRVFRVNPQHPLYRRCQKSLGVEIMSTLSGYLWARTCSHRFGPQFIHVTEVFLSPALYAHPKSVTNSNDSEAV